MIPIFPAATKLFEENNCSIKKFDAVFREMVEAVRDGYFTIPEKGDLVFLFIVGGRPYASGRAERQGRLFLDIQEFFDTYNRVGAADLNFYTVEKKLILSILVYFKKQPLQKFTADTVDMKKFLDEMAARGTDSIIAIRCGDKMGFSVCPKGEPSFNYLPDNAHAQKPPKEGLLSYILNEKGCVPSIEVFDDIRMTPAPDAISSKDTLPEMITARYARKPPVPASVTGAEAVLMLADKTIGRYAIAKTETTIGRSPGSDILIENPDASMHHAVIRENVGRFFIEDTGSAGGTFVNGKKVTSRELSDSDQIQVLNYIILFRYPPSERAETAADTTTPLEKSQAKAAVPGNVSKLVLEDGQEHILKSTVTTIGGGEEMTLRLEKGSVAEHQASILRGKGGGFVLVHKNGKATKVNGEKIREHHLKNGDMIAVGEYKIKYLVT